MIDSFQHLIMSDRVTAVFALAFYAALLALGAASLAYSVAVPKRPPAGRAGERSALKERAKAAASGFGRWVASLDVTPNQITVIGLLLLAFNCAIFAWHQRTFAFGASLIVAFLFDALDGVVARAQGTSSKWGGYLDAATDRYHEVLTYLTIAWVLDAWPAAFAVITGSLLVSYNKARAAIEVPVDNKGWPDLFGKPVRMFVLCVALLAEGNLPWILPFALWSLAAMTHFTALQRMGRAYFLIRDGGGAPPRRAGNV